MLIIQPPGIRFVARSGVSDYDYTISELVADGSWHELDLSAIIGGSAKGVSLHVDAVTTLANKVVAFAPHGTGTDYFRWQQRVITQGPTWTLAYPFVPVVGGPSIDYLLQTADITTCNITILGWWR